MSIEAMKKALEALLRAEQEIFGLRTDTGWTNQTVFKESSDITSLRAAIEAAEKQEPVAQVGCHNFDDGGVCLICGVDIKDAYTTLPQPAIPDGMVLVPISMVEDTCPCCCQWSEDHSQAMLAAAPKEMK